MRAVTDHLNSNEACFLLKFINRTFCVFKCDFGYVGYRNKQSRLLECNKCLCTLFTIEDGDSQSDDAGIVHLKGKRIFRTRSEDAHVSIRY